ncbi:unnamed protein product [Prorocentrum cordatum]|uniref:MGS-like domain-containing protein n=1 Tax=Prorocentrum cordatum TaxID=2364126 RepID=A0ABN9PCJ7_9DINO|nr:unnamed protein product [Polarella glacialis]
MGCALATQSARVPHSVARLSTNCVPPTTPAGLDGHRYRIALVAHDNMKLLMRKFIQVHFSMLNAFEFTGTGTTCSIIMAEGLACFKQLASGPLGGDQQLGALVTEGTVHAVFFFRDPLAAHVHDAGIQALGRICDCHQCYFATNYRTAAAVLKTMYDNAEESKSTGRRVSVDLPRDTGSLSEFVQHTYLETRNSYRTWT